MTRTFHFLSQNCRRLALYKKADKQSGRAPFIDKSPRSLVIAASEDFIVDEEGSRESAKCLNLGSPAFVDSPHDVMLRRNWGEGASALMGWLEEIGM